MTNATKAAVIVLINAGLGLLIAFGVSVTDSQQAAITTFVNAALGLWVMLTYQNSSKRVTEN